MTNLGLCAALARTRSWQLTTALFVVLFLTPTAVGVTQTGELTVTATYTGKGTVDKTHEIIVFLFDHPNPKADSRPLMFQTIQKSGGSTTFRGLATQPVYVTLVYDEKGDYQGFGPPPAGSPIGAYTKAKKPVPVTRGANVKIVATFDDSQRFK